MSESFSEQLAGLLGSDAVLEPAVSKDYAVDGVEPIAVVRPVDRQGISQVLSWASSEKMAVSPRGGGTQLALGNTPKKLDLILDLGRYGSKAPDHQPADLTVTVEAGITLEALQAQLSQQGQFLPLEAPLASEATIGGILAANASGPMRYAYGLPRDWLIGISVVNAQGVETKSGGKVVKNVAGYDLNKLYTGSLGTLGVTVEATFKLSPLPPESGALVVSFSSLPEGIQAVSHLLRQVFAPQGLQVIDGPVAQRIAPTGAVSSLRDQHESGLAHGREATVVAFFSGRPRAVKRRLDDATILLQDAGAKDVARLDVGESSVLLRGLTDIGWTSESPPYLSLKINLPSSAVGPLVDRLSGEATGETNAVLNSPHLENGTMADPAFGSMRLLWWQRDQAPPTAHGDNGGPTEAQVVAVISSIRDRSRRLGGSVVVEHCPLSVKQQIDVWGGPPEGIEIMRRIKGKFDPAGILNPGRFVGGI